MIYVLGFLALVFVASQLLFGAMAIIGATSTHPALMLGTVGVALLIGLVLYWRQPPERRRPRL